MVCVRPCVCVGVHFDVFTYFDKAVARLVLTAGQGSC